MYPCKVALLNLVSVEARGHTHDDTVVAGFGIFDTIKPHVELLFRDFIVQLFDRFVPEYAVIPRHSVRKFTPCSAGPTRGYVYFNAHTGYNLGVYEKQAVTRPQLVEF